jgi:cobalt-zinc-cadmium efflux system outer membrane protein
VALTVTAWAAAEVQAQPAAATTAMTVDQLVARALADNPDLRASRAEVEAAVARVRQAGLRPNPMLDLGGQKAIGTDNNLMIGFTWPLDRGGRKEGRVTVAEREVDMKRAQVLDRERRLVADVRMKAGDYFAARRNLGVTDDLVGVNQDALRLVRDRVREGAQPALEENLMLVEVNRLEATRHVQASRVDIAALQLRLLAGMAPDAPLSLRGDLATVAAPPDRREALDRALAARPDVTAARAESATARARIRKEEAEARWDASVNVGYQRQDFGFMLNGITDSGAMRPIQDVFHYFGAGITITLPVRNRNQGNIAAAEAEARAADRRVEFMELMIRQEVEAAFAQYDAALRSRAIYERGVREIAARNLDVVRKTYGLGRGSLLDVVAEQRRYIDVENGYTDVLKQVFDAAVEIERGVGGAGR